MIASGALSPLTGFMTRAAYEGVLANARLPDGRPWGLPVTLAVTRAAARSTRAGPVAARGSAFMQHRHRWPLELRGQIMQRGWRQVAVPHIKHPWRRTHEYTLKGGPESSAALLLPPPPTQ